ncbi:hypothetical protein VRRI112168_14890 [Vreelandella rituensis]|uniref:Helix-turn-helix domain-containing protein n=1 Tax=Vreelandella rituensis TaxID=2282306 RepID=A0A368UA10_9GAMM|nr:hypothetical protein [Halomonas rituensis]RCV93791.1 hypothetical protein DU506_01140 [Halomonas rituensis]
MNESQTLDGVDYLRAGIGAALLSLAQRRGWDAKQAAKSMGASELHAESLLTGKAGGIPLEVLVDMTTYAGAEIHLKVELPE